MTWKDDWDETFDTIRKKVLSDTQSYGYMTSIDDIMNWPGHDWYNTELNPVKPVSFIAKRGKEKWIGTIRIFHISLKNVLFRILTVAGV